MILTLWLYFFVFIFGLCIGSFLNVVIFRLRKGESAAKGRSYCPDCQHVLGWPDLIPVLSYFFLSGKCRYCKKPISLQYPVVELATALLFLLVLNFEVSTFSVFSISRITNLFFWWYITSSLMVIFVYDVKHYLIPDVVLFPAIIITFLYRLTVMPLLLNYLVAAGIAAGFFLLIFLFSRGAWMGFGDVKLAILLGLLLGVPNILVGLFLAFFFGAIIALALIFLGKKGLKSQLPFAPFLIIGTLAAILFGAQIIHWYLNFLIV